MNIMTELKKIRVWADMIPATTVVFLVSGKNKIYRNFTALKLFSIILKEFEGECILLDYNVLTEREGMFPPEYVIHANWNFKDEINVLTEYFDTQFVYKINVDAGESSSEETDLTDYIGYDLILYESDLEKLNEQLRIFLDTIIKGD